MKNLQYLLKELNLLREKYLNVKEQREQFNIFTTLLDPYNTEVELHSRFISSLLDPTGAHGLGSLPIELFLEELGSIIPLTPNIEVVPNNDTWTEHKEIDILIIDRIVKTAIIIENKIRARDSNHEKHGQLEGYYQTIISEGIPEENIEVYYLTIDRHEPSTNSTNTNGRTPELTEKVKCIDYATEITNWLQSLAKEAYKQPFLRETINQYINLIKDMTGNIEIEERLELMSLVGKSSDNLKSAKLLIENFCHICWHTIDCFNNEFLQALEEQHFKVMTSPDEDTITNLVHGGPIQRKVEFYYEFEGKNGMVWTLQADFNDGNGFYLGLEKESNKKLTKIQKDAIKQHVADNKYNSDANWLYWQYIAPTYNMPILYFWDFTMPNTGTFDLISPTKRKEIINSYVKAIKMEMKFSV